MKQNKPSSTAIFVANGIWWMTNHARLFVEVPDLMGSLNIAMVKYINTGLFSVQHMIGRWLLQFRVSIMQRAAVPGFYLHFVVRKRCIEEFTRTAIENGAEQLIVIGAGFDTLSLRITTECPDISVVEIDHPATQGWKRKALACFDQRFDNLHLLPLDLHQDTMQDILLRSACYDRNKSSIFVAEGLTMYLTEKEVRDILDFIKEDSGPGSCFIFTYMEEHAEGDYQFRNASWITSAWLRIKKEEFTWGLRNAQMAPFLKQSGFQLLHCKTHKELRERFVSDANSDAPLAIGENIAVARLD